MSTSSGLGSSGSADEKDTDSISSGFSDQGPSSFVSSTLPPDKVGLKIPRARIGATHNQSTSDPCPHSGGSTVPNPGAACSSISISHEMQQRTHAHASFIASTSGNQSQRMGTEYLDTVIPEPDYWAEDDSIMFHNSARNNQTSDPTAPTLILLDSLNLTQQHRK